MTMITVVEDYTPIYVGDTSTPLTVYFTDRTGKPWTLANQSGFSIYFQHLTDPTKSFTGANTGTIVGDPANGIGEYVYDATDVDVAGEYAIQCTLIPSGKKFDKKPLEILE